MQVDIAIFTTTKGHMDRGLHTHHQLEVHKMKVQLNILYSYYYSNFNKLAGYKCPIGS